MTNESNARDQAQAQMNSIRAMVAALECDYERLEELREERTMLRDELDEAIECVKYHHDDVLDETGAHTEHDEYRRCRDALAAWEEENAAELAELSEAAGDYGDREAAEQAIQEDPLSVEVRSDWHAPGEDTEPTHFSILLCTGGPAVRILGELGGYGTPACAWLEYQDWGTPWTERVNQPGDMDTLLTYAQQFYFAE